MNIRNIRVFFLSFFLGLFLAGCSSTGKDKFGAGVGALTGGAAGYFIADAAGGNKSVKIAAGLAGALIGSYIGHEIGKHLDEEDRRKQAEATKAALALPDGGSSSWSSPDKGTEGKARVLETFAQNDKNCRKIEHAITAQGETTIDTTTSCEDGSGGYTLMG